jgi:hypothetical protein
MLYLDTSAVVKLIRREPQTDALADWLDDHLPTPWVSSTLVEVELPRALRRTDSASLIRVPAVIARIARYEIDDVVRAAAAAFPDPETAVYGRHSLGHRDCNFRAQPHCLRMLRPTPAQCGRRCRPARPEPGHRVAAGRRHAALVLR